MSFSDQTRRLWALTALSAAGFAAGLALMLAYAGTDRFQGEVQRLFYFHLSSFTGAFLAFTVALAGGLAYLFTRQTRWDRLALSAVEVGFVLSLINVCLGSVWARPTWNTWWTNDPRMVTSAVMMLTCLAYLVLRHSIENPQRRRLAAAALGIVLMGTLIATVAVTRVRGDTIHPVVIGPSPQNVQGGVEMAASMSLTLLVNVIIWTFLMTPALIGWRVRLEHRRELMSRRAAP